MRGQEHLKITRRSGPLAGARQPMLHVPDMIQRIGSKIRLCLQHLAGLLTPVPRFFPPLGILDVGIQR